MEGRELYLSCQIQTSRHPMWIPDIIAGKFQIFLPGAGGCQRPHSVQAAGRWSGEALGDQSPKPPGIYCLGANPAGGHPKEQPGGDPPGCCRLWPLAWRSGRVPALPYPPARSPSMMGGFLELPSHSVARLAVGFQEFVVIRSGRGPVRRRPGSAFSRTAQPVRYGCRVPGCDPGLPRPDACRGAPRPIPAAVCWW